MRTTLLALAAALLAGTAQADDAHHQRQRHPGRRQGRDHALRRLPDRRRRQDRRGARKRAIRGPRLPASSTSAGEPCFPGLIDAHGHVIGLGQALSVARPRRNRVARRSEVAAQGLCRRQPGQRLARWSRLEPGAVAGQSLPDLGRPRLRRLGPASRALPGRWPCAGRQFQGARAGGRHRRDPVAERRADRKRPVRRCRAGADRLQDPRTERGGHGRGARQGAGGDAQGRAHRRRTTWAPASTIGTRCAGPARKARSRSASSAMRRACPPGGSSTRAPLRAGSSTTASPWSAPSSTPTARSARAAPSSSILMPTSPTRAASA